MKRLKFLLTLMFVLAITTVACAVEAVAPSPAPGPSPIIGMIEWFSVNKAIVFGAALALSELLAITPWLKGNGILDTIIKALAKLAGRPSQVPH